jgi:signal peptidase II
MAWPQSPCFAWSNPLSPKTKIILWVSLSLVFLDQVSKIWIVNNVCPRGDDICQEEAGHFSLVERTLPDEESNVIENVDLAVQGETLSGTLSVGGEDFDFEGSYSPENRNFKAQLVDGPQGAKGSMTSRKARVFGRSFAWTVQFQLELPQAGQVELQAIQTTRRVVMDAAGFHLIPGVLQIVHSQNTGAAFGIGTEFKYRMLVFYVFTGFAVWVLWGLYKELEPNDRLGAWIVGLIAAGAVGNLIDRIHKQSVTDFVRVHWGPDSWLTGLMGSPEWPSFNVADMAIVGGVGLFVIQYLFYEDRQGDNEEADEEPLVDDSVDDSAVKDIAEEPLASSEA